MRPAPIIFLLICALAAGTYVFDVVRRTQHEDLVADDHMRASTAAAQRQAAEDCVNPANSDLVRRFACRAVGVDFDKP